MPKDLANRPLRRGLRDAMIALWLASYGALWLNNSLAP